MAGVPHRPIAVIDLLYHRPPKTGEATPEPGKELVRRHPTTIHDFLAIKLATWPTWKPWQIFEAERVVDIAHGIHGDTLTLANDDEWLQRDAGEHSWNCFLPLLASPEHTLMPRELLKPELKNFNDQLRGAMHSVLETAFAGDTCQPEYLGLHVRGLLNQLIWLRAPSTGVCATNLHRGQRCHRATLHPSVSTRHKHFEVRLIRSQPSLTMTEMPHLSDILLRV
jgi:hypothetical protein